MKKRVRFQVLAAVILDLERPAHSERVRFEFGSLTEVFNVSGEQ